MIKFHNQEKACEWVIMQRKHIRNLRAEANRLSQIANNTVDEIHAVKKDWELEEDL